MVRRLCLLTSLFVSCLIALDFSTSPVSGGPVRKPSCCNFVCLSSSEPDWWARLSRLQECSFRACCATHWPIPTLLALRLARRWAQPSLLSYHLTLLSMVFTFRSPPSWRLSVPCSRCCSSM